MYTYATAHMTNSYLRVISLISIVLLAAFLRLYQLGSVPHGMTWDEAAIGYNGHAILTTRRDEWLERLPVSFRSFGDYKAPLAIYLNGIFTYVFGMNLLAVRLPFALAGIGTVVVSYFLSIKLFGYSRYRILLSLMSAAIFATVPWHLHYSRVGFESGLALFFLMLGLYFFWQIFEQTGKKLYLFGTLATFFLSLTLYTYHSAKIVVPVLMLSVTVIYWSKLKKHMTLLLILGVLAISILYPLIKDSIWGNGLQRAQVSLFAKKSLTEATLNTTQNLFLHLEPSFLIKGETNDLRHGDARWGVLYSILLLPIIFAIFQYFFRAKESSKEEKKLITLSLAWIIIGLIPAAISPDIPHSNRALLALPGFVLLTVAGIDILLAKISGFTGVVGKKSASSVYFKMILGTGVLIYTFLVISYLQNYFTQYSRESAEAFTDGYLEAFTIAKDYERGENGKKEVEKIIFTSEYGQPYIFALFVRKTNPIWYQGGSLAKYEFTDAITVGDLSRDNALVITGRKTAIEHTQPAHTIYGSDGQVRFMIHLTEDRE